MTDGILNLEALAKVLREKRDSRSRRALARAGSLALSQLARLEGGEGDVTLGTLLKAAETYGMHPLDLFAAAASLTPQQCAKWARESDVGAELELGPGRMVLEARVPRELLDELAGVVTRLDASAAELEQLRPLVPVFTALVAALGEGYEDSLSTRELDGIRGALQRSAHGHENSVALTDVDAPAGAPEDG